MPESRSSDHCGPRRDTTTGPPAAVRRPADGFRRSSPPSDVTHRRCAAAPRGGRRHRDGAGVGVGAVCGQAGVRVPCADRMRWRTARAGASWAIQRGPWLPAARRSRTTRFSPLPSSPAPLASATRPGLLPRARAHFTARSRRSPGRRSSFSLLLTSVATRLHGCDSRPRPRPGPVARLRVCGCGARAHSPRRPDVPLYPRHRVCGGCWFVGAQAVSGASKRSATSAKTPMGGLS